MLDIHTPLEYYLLRPAVKDVEVEAAVLQAIQYRLAAICVPPYWIKKVSRDTKPAGISLISVVGYPFGYQRTEAKVAEMELAFADGAQEIDLTLNLSALKSQRWNWIKAEIARFSKSVHEKGYLLTVSIDANLLTEEELARVCKDAADAGADYFCAAIGTFSKEAAETKIRFIRKKLHPSVGIKAFLHQPTAEQVATLLTLGVEKACLADLTVLPENFLR